MLPASISNASPDAERRRSSRLSASSDGPLNPPAVFVALDSPADRVAARRRKMTGRHSSVNLPPAEATGSSIAGPAVREKSEDVSFQQKKELIPTDSSRSLDSAALRLDIERVQRLQTEKIQSPSHKQARSSSERNQRTIRIVGPISTTGTPSSAPGRNRANLPDFKSMFRRILPSKKPYQEQEQQDQIPLRSASARLTRMTSNPVPTQRQTEVRSEHRRTALLGQRRTGSDTALYLGTERTPEIDATRRLSTPTLAETGAATVTITSPGLIKKIWQKSSVSSQRLNSSTSRPATASLDGEDGSIATRDSIDTASFDDKASKGFSRRPLASVLSSSLTKNASRSELVRQLSLRDSLRVRDRSHGRQGDGRSDAQDTQSTTGKPTTQQQESPPLKTTTQIVVADSLPSSSISTSPSFFAVKGMGTKASMQTHQGHSSWPAASSEHHTKLSTPQAKRKSKRSSSSPPKPEKELDRSARKSKSKSNKSTDGRAHSNTTGGRFSSSGHTDSTPMPSPSSQRLSHTSAPSKTKTSKGVSGPLPENEPSQRRGRVAEHTLGRTGSNLTAEKSRQGSRAQESDTQSGRRSKKQHASSSALLVSPTSPLKSKKHASASTLLSSRRGLESSTSNLDSSTGMSTSKRKIKVKREEKEDRSPSKSRRHRPMDSSSNHDAADPVVKHEPKKSQRTSKKDTPVHDASERSLTVDDIAGLDDSENQSFEEGKATRKKKMHQESPSSRLYSSSRSSKPRNATPKMESRAWQSDQIGLGLSASFDESLHASRKKEESFVNNPTRRSKTGDNLTGKPSSTSSKERSTKAARAPGKSPHKAQKVRNRKKGVHGEVNDAKTSEGSEHVSSQNVAPGFKKANVSATRDRGTDTRQPFSKENPDGPCASNHKTESNEREQNRVSIESYLAKDAEATEHKQWAQKSADDESTYDDSHGQLPSLADILSIDLSTESSTTSSSQSTDEAAGTLPGGDANGMSSWVTSALIRADNSVSEGLLASLDNIANDSKDHIIAEPTRRNSLDLMSLKAADIFFDSPDGSPTSHSLQLVWVSPAADAVVESMARSLPNLDNPRKPRPSDAFKPAMKANADEAGSQGLPELVGKPGDNIVNVKSDIAEQLKGRHEKKGLQPRRFKEDLNESCRASLISEFTIASSPERPSATDSPRLVKATSTSKAKQDRGPRKPQRRSDSFEGEKDPLSPLEGLSAVAQHLESLSDGGNECESMTEAQANDSSLSPSFGTTKMEFRRAEGVGWIQIPPENRSELGQDRLSSSQQSDDSGTQALGGSERASLGDLEGATAVPQPESVTSPSSTSKSCDNMLSVSMEGVELRHLFSLPRVSETKELERTYLPVSLQNAARRHERAGKQSPRESPRAAANMKREPDTHPGGRTIDVGTGVSHMLEKIRELEDELFKSEHQATLLRVAQRELLLEEESEELE